MSSQVEREGRGPTRRTLRGVVSRVSRVSLGIDLDAGGMMDRVEELAAEAAAAAAVEAVTGEDALPSTAMDAAAAEARRLQTPTHPYTPHALTPYTPLHP